MTVATSGRGPRVVVLAGGVGGSTFTAGVRDEVAARAGALTVVCNTGDDLWLSGLRIQPDVDSMLYALADVKDRIRGWGRAGDSTRVSAELHAWGVGWDWFELGDLDLGAHIARTSWLREGLTPTEVLARLQARWQLGATLLPMTDAEVDTHVVLPDGTRLHFQEWWTRHRARLEPEGFENAGIDTAPPASGVVEAIRAADAVLIAPSNPIVSIGLILAVPGIAQAVRESTAPVVGVSPIIGGAPVRGMADVCLRVAGVPCTAAGVAGQYGSRAHDGVLDHWLIGEEDAAECDTVAATGVVAHVEPLWMSDAARTRALAVAALRAAGI